jgi:hypothetical protein
MFDKAAAAYTRLYGIESPQHASVLTLVAGAKYRSCDRSGAIESARESVRI